MFVSLLVLFFFPPAAKKRLLEKRFRLYDRGEALCSKGGEAQVAQRGCGFPTPGSTQGQGEWGSEQSDLVKSWQRVGTG